MKAIQDFETTLKKVFYGENNDHDQRESGRKSQEASAKKERKKKAGKNEQPEENQPEENQPEEKKL